MTTHSANRASISEALHPERRQLTATTREALPPDGHVGRHSYLRRLQDVLRVMAPLQDQAWLQRVVARLEGAHQPRLKLPRMADSRCLEALGYTLMDEAMARLAEAAGDLAALLGYRDGLLIALLAAQPLRPRNPSASALPVTYSGTLRSSAKHYNQARSIDASRLLTRVLAQHRIAATTKPS